MIKTRAYEFRYLKNSTRVYYIGKRLSEPFHKRLFYSEPFISREQKDTRNVLMGFIDPEQAITRINQLKNVEQCQTEYKTDYHTIDVTLEDLKQIGKMIYMPVVVELYSYSSENREIVNIYYFS